MKILEITAFSSGICGLWSRVSKESELLSKLGHEVHVFSSNIKRGSGKIENSKKFEKKSNFKIHRFKTFGNFGKNTFFWNYSKQALKLKPDIIICHAYRQYYSTQAIKIAKKLNIPCILVTHAPFLEKKLRSPKLNLAVFLYDYFIGRRILNKYSKVFAITKWELPYLFDLGIKKEKIEYLPNGIPEEFFYLKLKKNNKTKQILFLGRIAPIKDIETLVKAFFICSKKDKNIKLNLVGPVEKEYGEKIKNLVNKLNLQDNVIFSGPIYDLKKKIRIIDDSNVFVLPSKREAMPQSLIEAMARKKITISSNTDGGKEIISNNKNGYLFEIGDEKGLANKILNSLEENSLNTKIKEKALESVKEFSWRFLIKKIDTIIKTQ
jgi:glycosyltransferase involved in cell wall biosynthesis